MQKKFELLIFLQNSRICIGLCTKTAGTSQLPGVDKFSFGYESNGKKLNGSSAGETYALQFGTGDVIGCCVNSVQNTISFTRNGVNMGLAFQLQQQYIDQVLFPAVGLTYPSQSVVVNFGCEPFVYKFENAVQVVYFILQQLALTVHFNFF